MRFKHELLLVVQGNTPGSFLAYSTFQNFNQLLQQRLRIPLIKVTNTKGDISNLLETALNAYAGNGNDPLDFANIFSHKLTTCNLSKC